MRVEALRADAWWGSASKGTLLEMVAAIKRNYCRLADEKVALEHERDTNQAKMDFLMMDRDDALGRVNQVLEGARLICAGAR